MLKPQSRLLFGFLFPAGLAVTLFYLIPAILTFLFSFTNMGSETGILGKRYILSGETLRRLEAADFNAEAVRKLARTVFEFDDRGLEALQASGLDPGTLREIRRKFSGKTYRSERRLLSDLKRLENRPRSHMERKKISKAVARTIKNTAFSSADELRAALLGLGIELSGKDFRTLLDLANTSWKWTLGNYKELFASQFSARILMNTLFYVFSTLLLFNTGLALLLALLTFYIPPGQSKFFRAIWLIPRISPSVLYILVWKWFTYDKGFISHFLEPMGVGGANWLMEFPWTFIIFINGFVGASMGLIIFSSAMQAIPRSILHAAEVDGAYPLQQAFRIVLPLMRWPILFITSYQTLSLLTSWEYIQLTTDGGPGFFTTEVWALHAYHTALSNYFGSLRYGYGSTLAVVLVLVGVGLGLVYLRLFNFKTLLSDPPIEN